MNALLSFLCCVEADSYKLMSAVRAGSVAEVRELVAKKPKLAWKSQQWGGQSAWHVAAREGQAEAMQAMAGALKAASSTALQPMRELGDTPDEIIETLACTRDSKGLTPLHLACIKGHADAALVLMELGANPFSMDSVGRTPLHYAASWGFADCINAVLGYHSGTPREGWGYAWPNTGQTPLVDVQNSAGFTPLHYAVWVGRKEAIQALASYDASLRIVNNGNDFEWIKVGSGNTPLHLAAFGGDMQVVKLLLAAYVQSLAAGAEVMTAGRGQWGNRATDDVRHVRNRRGWMPYHIAIHKGFDYLAELLHPDIPYTFIFSNEDMAPGSVRIYGPARLMVIAAKALQQKLVDELSAVETQTAAGSIPAAAAAAAPDIHVLSAANQHHQLCGGEVSAAAGIGSPAVIGAPVGSTEPAAASAAGLPASVSNSSQLQSLVSPFVAYTDRSFTSFSAGASAPTSAATSATAAGVPTPMGVSRAGTPSDALHPGPPAAAAVAAAAAAVAALPAVEVSPTDTDQTGTEHSFCEAGVHTAAAPAEAAAAAAAAGVQGVPHTSSFGGFAPARQQQQLLQDNASVSDAGLSNSSVPPSNAAVAGSAPGSLANFNPISRDSSSHKLPQSTLLTPAGAVMTVEASSADRSIQWSHIEDSIQQQVQQQQQQRSPPRHKRGHSAVPAVGYSRQGSRGLSDANGGARESSDDQTPSKFGWGRMESLKMRSSRKDFLEMLPPSAVQTCAEDDTDTVPNGTSSPQIAAAAAAASSRRSSQDNNGTSGRVSSSIRRISSLPTRVGGRTLSATAAAAAAAVGAEQQPHRASFPQVEEHPVHENPLNVVLAARADQIGDNPEAIRRQLLAMKLASGALQFDSAVSTFTASLNGPNSLAASRIASCSVGFPPSSRNSISSRAGPAGGSVSPAADAAAAVAHAAGIVQAAAATAATRGLPTLSSLGSEGGLGPFASSQHQDSLGGAVDGAVNEDAQQRNRGLSPSPSLFNLTAADVISRQQSQSLQRLLSGNLRGQQRAGSVVPPRQQQSCSSIPSLASPVLNGQLTAGSSSEVVVAAGGAFSSSGNGMSPETPKFAVAGNGDLPMVQLQPAGPAAVMISEGDDGDDDGVCEICFDAEAVVALQQCGHTLCVSCCKELCKLHHFKPGLCPYCRQIIAGFARATHVFIP